jgi:hypothetical protein
MNHNMERKESKATIDLSLLPPKEWDIYDSLDSTAPEVLMAKESQELTFFKRRRQKAISSYGPVRDVYMEQRYFERSSKKGQSGRLVNTFKIIAEYVVENDWIVNFTAMILDLIFCFFYLLEIQSNAAFPCQTVGACGKLNVPPFLLVSRFSGTYHILVGLSLIRFIIISFEVIFIYKRSVRDYLRNPFNFLASLLTIPFVALSPVPGSTFFYIPYFLAGFLVIPNLKGFLRARNSWNPVKYTVYYEKVIMLMAYIILLLFFGVATFNYFETRFRTGKRPEDGPLTLGETFYFIVITFTTVGYGEITPTTTGGQLVIVVLILVALGVLPSLVADLLETIKMQAAGGGQFIKKKNPFVVLCGDFSDTARSMEMICNLLRRVKFLFF